MAELRSDTDFMAALQLEHDEAAVRCDFYSTSEISLRLLSSLRERYSRALFPYLLTLSISATCSMRS